jgi:glycosyltransferase involved in cell wall biosynthesis
LASKLLPVAVIIPAFNEAKGIGSVLAVVRQADWIAEIVVVDDGSKDHTFEIASKCTEFDQRLCVIRHSKNLGKGQAIVTGLKATNTPVIMTLDADLIGLNPQHLMDLAHPVLVDSLDMAVAVFRKGRWSTDLSHRIAPWLTGQRCLLREKMDAISWNAAKGYGLETAITVAARRCHWRSEKVYWIGVSHPHSEGHRGIVRGIANRGKMYAQILRAMYISTNIKNHP